jgi:malonyl-CoA O-methyltransferase
MPSVPPSSSTTDSKYSAPIDLRRVRRMFADPARLADSDFLRREVASRMHERLALVRIAPRRVLDAGCGEGADLPLLQSRYTGAQVIGLDGSAAMASESRMRQLAGLSSMQRLFAKWLPGSPFGAQPAGPQPICGDFARLPLATHAVDLVWSNLALHWHPQPDQVFAEWRRALSIDGLLMFSCFGPDTFKELRTAFAAADDEAHALSFVDMHDFGDMLVNVGFSTPVMDMETITVTYENVDKLLADVRAWGGNPLMTRRASLFGRAAWKRAMDSLRGMRGADGRIPLTYEVIYGHAFRPVQTKTAAGESIVKFDLPKK